MHIVIYATRNLSDLCHNWCSINHSPHQIERAMKAKSQVTRYAAAESSVAVTHFKQMLSFETDCWDVHFGIDNDCVDFVLLDVRSPEPFARGHVPTAINLPHSHITMESLPPLQDGFIYVVYCNGPHCNGANKAALKIASLGLPVKMMIGGVEGWKDERFSLTQE